MRQSPVLSSFTSTPEARVLTGPPCGASAFSPPALPGFVGTSDPFRRPDGLPPFPACCAHYSGGPNRCTMVILLARARAGFFPIRSAFPGLATGRRPHCRFRGLLKLYACYGPPDCSPTSRGLCRGVSISPVSRTHRPPAIESNHQLFEWVLPPLVICPFWAHAEACPTRAVVRHSGIVVGCI